MPEEEISHESKYPKIITDERANSVNELLQKKITIEEYYDLLHHTHSMSSIVMDIGDSDGASFIELQNAISELSKTVNELKSTVESQKNTINELTETVNNLNNEVNNSVTVSDWDVETPGNQDPDGNDLGTIMGLTMTEIK